MEQLDSHWLDFHEIWYFDTMILTGNYVTEYSQLNMNTQLNTFTEIWNKAAWYYYLNRELYTRMLFFNMKVCRSILLF